MKLLGTMILAIAASALDTSAAASGLLIRAEPAEVFSGDGALISFTIHNPEPVSSGGSIRMQMSQLSSATATSVSQTPWKTIEVLPRQTLCETGRIMFPDVRSKTSFLIEWIDETNRILGRAAISVFPTNLLADLKAITSGGPAGVLDPENQLKPTFALNGVPCSDLDEAGLESASGPLVIAAHFSTNSLSRSIGAQLHALTKRGIAVVWIRPAAEGRDKLIPSFYTVNQYRGAAVVAKPDLVANFAASPRAQLNLLALAHMAVHPEPFDLPELEIEPTGPK